MPKRIKPPAPPDASLAPQQLPEPTALSEAIYRAEHRRRAIARNATFAQLLAEVEARQRKTPLAEDLRLSKTELVAIYEYTTDSQFISDFNQLTRESPQAADDLHGGFIAVLRNALAKLDSYKGQVWRGSGLLLSEMPTLTTKGAIWSPRQFWSTAWDIRGIEDYKDDIVFDIQSKTGKNVSQMSAKENDYEVLFLPEAVFRVDEFKEREAGKWSVWLTDLGEPDKEG